MSLSNAPKASDLEALKQKFKAADKDNSGALNRRGNLYLLVCENFQRAQTLSKLTNHAYNHLNI